MPLRPLRTAVGEWTAGRPIPTDPLYAVTAAWGGIVGDDVATHSAPLAVNGTTLVVATGSSAWSQQLQFLSLPILAGLRALRPPLGIERITFRVGAVRRSGVPRPPTGPRSRANVRSAGQVPEAAVDLPAALARLRQRIARVRASMPGACTGCSAPLDRPGAALCAPCAGRGEGERSESLERVLFMAPWLRCDELRAQFPRLTATEYERSRRRLLQRWWVVLERARRAAHRSATARERQVASSYVLLQSRLPPDRISPAVVRNLLGSELEAMLWPERAPDPAPGTRPGQPGTLSNTP